MLYENVLMCGTAHRGIGAMTYHGRARNPGWHDPCTWNWSRRSHVRCRGEHRIGVSPEGAATFLGRGAIGCGETLDRLGWIPPVKPVEGHKRRTDPNGL